jgi:hypothetical protein
MLHRRRIAQALLAVFLYLDHADGFPAQRLANAAKVVRIVVSSSSSSSSRQETRQNVAASFMDGSASPMDDSLNDGPNLLDERLFELDFTEVDRADAETELLVSRRRELLRSRFAAHSAGSFRFQVALSASTTRHGHDASLSNGTRE